MPSTNENSGNTVKIKEELARTLRSTMLPDHMKLPTYNGIKRVFDRITPIWAVVITIVFIVPSMACGAWWLARLVSERDRTQWKGPALERLAKLSGTNEEIRMELKALKADTNHTEFGWAHEHVLLMTNGEYIIYKYRHGANVYFPPHLFLGHASDGRWLYSSYHFCNGMMMVRADPVPASITEFARIYSAREFDGKSDECLKMTE